MVLILIALAPVFIILFYMYFRDKYEREPVGLLVKSLVAGILITVPVIFAEQWLTEIGERLLTPGRQVLWSAFIVAGTTEEAFKFLALVLLIWTNKNFNERFDGIVYAVFVSLGFALVENILYVWDGGTTVGWIRALTAVPAHALFGVTMGYYLALARFANDGMQVSYMIRALLWPVILHGFYDYCLMADHPVLLLAFIPFVVYLWVQGFSKMRELSNQSIFRDKRQ